MTEQAAQNRIIFVAVHNGAGYCNRQSRQALHQLNRSACLLGINTRTAASSDLCAEACKNVVQALENSPFTNAGLGSNLTAIGTVECDSGMMESVKGAFGGCSSVPDVPNAICVAHDIMMAQTSDDHDWALVPPMQLVGSAATVYAKQHGIKTCDDTSLITPVSRKRHHDAVELLNGGDPTTAKCARWDTVGAVVVDSQGVVTVGCSSGGITLKQSGRQGHSGVFGCGCWAEHDAVSGITIGVVTSGCGETLVRTRFAAGLGAHLIKNLASSDLPTADLIQHYINDEYLQSNIISMYPDRHKVVAALVVVVNESSVELVWAHNCRNLCIGYSHVPFELSKVKSTADASFKHAVSTVADHDTESNRKVVASGICVKITPKL